MRWAELPAKLRIYILALSGLAFVIVCWSIRDLTVAPHDNYWIVITVLVIFTVPFSLLLPSVSTAVGIGDTYIMAIGMMYGVSPCIVATGCQTLCISIFAKRPQKYPYKIVFNISSTICGAWLYSSIYSWLNNESEHVRDIIVPAAILAVTFFLVNSLLTSIAIAWSTGESIPRFWRKTCIPLAQDYSISAVYATAMVLTRSVSEYIPLLVAPFLGFIWGWHKLAEARVLQAEKHIREQEDLYLRTVESLALAVDAKDQTTYGHIRRVKVYSMGLARLCGIKDQNELRAIETGSLLHDIGKLAIDDYILNKPGRLSKVEFEKMKVHAAAGDEILQQVCFPFPVAKYVRYHHERWDGLGYPDGLKGEEIPLGARILAIADAFDAIRYSRPYKMSVETGEALEILKNQAGTVFDPRLVQLFTDNIGELEQEAAGNRETLHSCHSEGILRPSIKTSGRIAQRYPQAEISSELISLSEFCASVCRCLEFRDVFPVMVSRLKALVPFHPA